MPVFETQVPDCEHNRDSQYMEQSELVKMTENAYYIFPMHIAMFGL